MIDTIYIEYAVELHPRVLQILQRFPAARVIYCKRYAEVFNPRSQNFRLQKQRPALILAEKHNNFILSTPKGYGLGAELNYYFSYMLNCLYDCRYCFLQGMYQSANYVLFVNYEDFFQQIIEICQTTPYEDIYFFSGYDCDSLAFEPVTDFAAQFLPIFKSLPNAWLELRTKSTQIRSLLNSEPFPRCITAFSLSPEIVANKVEAKAPSLHKRLSAAASLQEKDWPVGLRFDPLIYQDNYLQVYREFFQLVFDRVNADKLHSVSLGVFRLPEQYFKKMHKLYPDEKLFASPLVMHKGMVSYQTELEQNMLADCTAMLLEYIPNDKLFACKQ